MNGPIGCGSYVGQLWLGDGKTLLSTQHSCSCQQLQAPDHV